eukprot:PhF_6_TR26235/c0_g2_i4/m.37456
MCVREFQTRSPQKQTYRMLVCCVVNQRKTSLKAVCCFQKVGRGGMLRRDTLYKLSNSWTLLRACFGGALVRCRLFTNKKDRIEGLQRVGRSGMVRSVIRNERLNILCVQRLMRGLGMRKELAKQQRQRQILVKLFKNIHQGMLARIALNRMRFVEQIVRACSGMRDRGALRRRHWRERIVPLRCLQQLGRAFLIRKTTLSKLFHVRQQLRLNSTRLIQRCCRSARERSHCSLVRLLFVKGLQRVGRSYLAQKRLGLCRKQKAIVLLQRCGRGLRCRGPMARWTDIVLHFQRMCKGFLVRRRFYHYMLLMTWRSQGSTTTTTTTPIVPTPPQPRRQLRAEVSAIKPRPPLLVTQNPSAQIKSRPPPRHAQPSVIRNAFISAPTECLDVYGDALRRTYSIQSPRPPQISTVKAPCERSPPPTVEAAKRELEQRETLKNEKELFPRAMSCAKLKKYTNVALSKLFL